MKTVIYSFLLGIVLIFSPSCSTEGTLDEDFWRVRITGNYKIVSVQTVTYSGQNVVSNVTLSNPNTTMEFESGKYETGHVLNITGDWLPAFLKGLPNYAWVNENDNKRLTFGYNDPSVGFFARASLSVQNMGGKSQVWTYIQVFDATKTYINQTIKVEKTN